MATKPVLTLCVVAKNQIYALTMASIIKVASNRKLCTKFTIQQSLSMDRSDLPKARSASLTNWYEQAKPNDIFMFIDADQVFKPADVQRSIGYLRNDNIVCGAYPRKNNVLTVEPINNTVFLREGEGELYYGATGFMMMSYNMVDKIAKHLGRQICISDKESAYTFFYERIVREEVVGEKDLWLGEDYSFCWLVRQLGGTIYGYYSNSLGHIITKDVYPSEKYPYQWPNNSIVVYCGMTAEQWSAPSIKNGIGGSESAVIYLTKFWAQNGYDVTVYCNCDRPGNHNGVRYIHSEGFNFEDQFNILVVWRAIGLMDKIKFKAKKVLLDLHDIVSAESITPNVIENVDMFCVKSNFHKEMLKDVPEENIAVIPNGGWVEPDPDCEKDPNYLIYTSSYDRGLAYMLRFGWPIIKKACPNAYLKIYYGWQGFDSVQPNTEDVLLYKKILLKLMKQKGVKECGRISNKELLKEKNKASIHYYMGDFQEIDCISVRESAAVGAVPVVSSHMKVFREKPYCVLIDGDPHKQATQKAAAEKIISLLHNQEELKSTCNSVPKETWESTAKHWLNLF